METPISKSQLRAITLAGLTAPNTYQEAAALLESNNLRSDAVPMGGTWRTAAKLSDAELMTAIRLAPVNDEVIDRY